MELEQQLKETELAAAAKFKEEVDRLDYEKSNAVANLIAEK